MKVIAINIILLVLTGTLAGQNMIGYKPDKIERLIKKDYRHLVKDSNSRNEHYNYLKYTDGEAGMTTVYFFLSENNRCNRIKSMHIHSIKDKIIKDLDSLYNKTGENTWSDKNRGREASIKLVNEEWFFTVTIEPEKKE